MRQLLLQNVAFKSLFQAFQFKIFNDVVLFKAKVFFHFNKF